MSYLLLAAFAAQTLAIDFTNSKWIWTNEAGVGANRPPGSRAFRRVYNPTLFKTPVSANILITADNGYTLYVNGNQVGVGHNWPTAQGYCVSLSPTCNVFAVNATNDLTVPNPAGVLASIEITYSDGSIDKLVTDASWRFRTSVPFGFEQVGFDDSNWSPAVVEGNYGVAPWNTITTPASGFTQVGLADTTWIWTDEMKNGAAPIGFRAFRKTITIPAGHKATSATIFIAFDDSFSLYVQGRVVGSGTTWQQARKYVVNIQPEATTVTIALYAGNIGGPAGLALAVNLAFECGNGGTSFVTDNSWKYNHAIPSGFEQPGFNDSAWPAAVLQGKFGTAPLGGRPIPTATSPPSGPLPGAPSGSP